VSTLSSQIYTQDNAGRVSTVQETVGEKCVTRSYVFTTATDRSSTTAYGPAADGSCQTATAMAAQTWTYDTANRVNTSGYVYDALGRTLAVPAIDTGAPAAGAVTATYHADDLVDTITQGGRTTDYAIDVMGERVRSWTDNSTGAVVQNVQHYDGDEDSPVWTQEGPDRWTRVVPGLAGMTAVLDSDSGVPEWQVSDLSGDIVATIHNGDEGLSTTNEATEYGVLADSESIGKQRYGWLGENQRAADTPSGIVLMGVRLYNPATGRFLQTDPVYGGSCNAYEYTCADPIDKTDLDGKKWCWTPVCHYKKAKKIVKGWYKSANKYKWVRVFTQNRYLRSCIAGAIGVSMFDTIKNGRAKLATHGRRWGIAGCAAGLWAYHGRRTGWW
jgi:RHS repeat-associated protein